MGALSGSAISLLAQPHGQGNEFGSMGACYIRNSQSRIPVEMNMGRAFVLELMFSFMLALVYFGSLIKPRIPSRTMETLDLVPTNCSLSIGLAYLATVLGSSGTGGCVNPARQFATELIASSWRNSSWVFYIAPLLGCVIGGLLYELILTEPRESYIVLK